MINFLDALPINQLLASLPSDALEAVAPLVRPVDLKVGATVYEANTLLRDVYFPDTAVISLFSPLQNGAGAEIAVVGHEGVVGVCAFMGEFTSLSSAVVQRAGRAWRMGAREIADLAHSVEPVRKQLLRYTQVLFTHMAQTSVCHRHHGLAAQLCTWLLQHLDRQADDELRVTQERIAGMLGMRREGVTEAALKLQREGSICYSRGRIQVLDRAALEQQCCECYGVVRRAYEQLSGCGWAGPRESAAAITRATPGSPFLRQLSAAPAVFRSAGLGRVPARHGTALS